MRSICSAIDDRDVRREPLDERVLPTVFCRSIPRETDAATEIVGGAFFSLEQRFTLPRQ